MKVWTHGKERIIGFPILLIVHKLEGAENSDLDSIIQKKKSIKDRYQWRLSV
jgi:hypothetical protein